MRFYWRIHGIILADPWEYIGRSMGFYWRIHGIILADPWDYIDRSMGLYWRIHGIILVDPLDYISKSIGWYWRIHRIIWQIHGIILAVPWYYIGRTMGLHSWIHGIILAVPWYYIGGNIQWVFAGLTDCHWQSSIFWTALFCHCQSHWKLLTNTCPPPAHGLALEITGLLEQHCNSHRHEEEWDDLRQ